MDNVLFNFSEKFSRDVFILYKEKEDSFDKDGIHGVLHISRSLVAGYIIAKKLIESGNNVNLNSVLLAIAYHDSGRLASGEDFWTHQSSLNCKKEDNYASLLIPKSAINSYGFDAKCVYDAAVLEIMRPGTGRGGIYGFIKEKLSLLNELTNFYNAFIYEWWGFINITEVIKHKLSGPDSVERLIDIIKSNKTSLKIIYGVIAG